MAALRPLAPAAAVRFAIQQLAFVRAIGVVLVEPAPALRHRDARPAQPEADRTAVGRTSTAQVDTEIMTVQEITCAASRVLEVLEVDILWPRWVARIGVTRSTQACFLAADRQCTELPLLRLPRLVPEVVGCDPCVPRDLARVGWRGARCREGLCKKPIPVVRPVLHRISPRAPLLPR